MSRFTIQKNKLSEAKHWSAKRILPRGRHAFVNFFLCLLLITSTWGPAWAADSGPWPAQDWNQANLKRITVPAATSLTFAVLGDNRDGPAIFGQLLRQINGDPEVAFAIHLGDMVRDADLEKYHHFFTLVRQNLQKPLLTVIGNHELKGEEALDLYRRIFGPADYSLQLGNHYFLVVNDAAKTRMEDQQFQWLEDELKKAQSYGTRLVFLHVPLFDPRPGKHHAASEALGCRLLGLFQKYRVTHVFAGHVHSYFTGKWEGVPYTISGGAGAALYGEDADHYFFHWLKVSVRGDKVQIQVRRLPEKGCS